MLRNSTTLEKLIDQSLTEAKAETSHIKTSEPLSAISLSPTDLSYKSKKVKNIRMIGHFGNSKCQFNPDMMAATRLILKFEDGTSSVLEFKNPADVGAQLQMYSLIHSCGGVPDHAFTDYGVSADNSEVWAHEKLAYTPQIRQFYDKAHSKIAELLVDHINKNPAYLAQAKKHGVYIVSLGCGDGKDMQVCYQQLLKAGFNNCFAMGIDSSKNFIEENKGENTSHAFFHGDIQQIGSVLAELARDGKFVPGDKLIVVIASGSLTRHVLDGSYPAHKIFQQLAAQGFGKIMVATGWTKPLMNDYSLTSSGWHANVLNPCFDQANPQSLLSYAPVFVCDRQTFQEEYDTVILKSRTRGDDFSILDLSLASHPLAIFDKFLHEEKDCYMSKVTKIDLSWSQFSSIVNISMLLNQISQFKNIEIIISGNEPWADLFIHQLQNQPLPVSITLKQRTDNTCKHELATLPINEGRQLGAYKNPYKKILEVKATAEEKCETLAKADPVVNHLLRHSYLAASRNNLFAVELNQDMYKNLTTLHPLNLQTGMPVDINENNVAQSRPLKLK